MNMSAVQFSGALAAAFAVIVLVRIAIPAPKRLSSRVRPYTALSRSALGRTPDIGSVMVSSATTPGGSAIERLVRPIANALARPLVSFLGQENQIELARRLRQAGIDGDLEDAQRVHNYRVRQVSKAVIFGAVAVVVAVANGFEPATAFMVIIASVVGGALREPARLSKLLQTRVDRMRVELYTVNQQLAMYLRTGGSSIQAAQRLCARGNGEVIAEMREALRLHERGMTAAKAFSRIADNTPEPLAARTYRMLASGSERGSDLAEALLSLSEDVRDSRRESLRRNATRRRGQMLIPTIGLMAPILILFIAAPMPRMIFGIR